MVTVIMVTNMLFNAKISKMGDNSIIWIPKSLSEMINHSKMKRDC